MLVKYTSNNSGGRWWLSDEDWIALEQAGWNVNWMGPKKSGSLFHGKGKSFKEADKNRWLDAVAREATKDFPFAELAIREWESITHQSATDEGCNCCGPPHMFNWTDDKGDAHYVDGDDCCSYLYGTTTEDLRSACDKIEQLESKVKELEDER